MGKRSITSPAAAGSRFSSVQPALVLLTILQLTGFIATTTGSSNQRIAEGETTTLGQYPYVLSFGLNLFDGIFHLHTCTGFILTETWAITSARCVEDAAGDPSYYYWLAGTNHLRQGGIHYALRQIIVHPGYSPADSEIHDIALVQVTHPFEFSATIQPIELSTATPEATSGTLGAVVGWGIVSQIIVQPDILRSGNVTILDIAECQEIYAPWDMNINGDYQFCAVTTAQDQAVKEHILKTPGEFDPLKARDACRGDEGGPFFPLGTDRLSRALGFVSWTFGCTPNGYPSVYTKLSGYHDWISEVTGYWIL